MHILLTGFAPFDGEDVNPSWEAVRSFTQRTILGHRISVSRLPVEFHVARELLSVEIAESNPDLVFCLGQAGGRPSLSIERIAINLADARIPDTAGFQPREQRLIEGAPAAYFAPFDCRRAQSLLQEKAIPAEISLSAGSFVCNDVFFGLCHSQANTHPKIRGTFIHIPYSPAQTVNKPGTPSMAIDLVIAALETLIGAADTP